MLLSEELCPGRDWWGVAQAIVGHSTGTSVVDCIQLREKTLSDGELLARARQLVGLCRPRGVAVVINDRPETALAAGADGVHLGQDDLSCAEARGWVGENLIIGVSTSCIEQARAAAQDGADYCGVGPMFATATKQKDRVAGPGYLREYIAWGKLPHLAIGGISSTNISQLIAVGVRGVAVSRAVCAAADPGAAAARLWRQVSTTPLTSPTKQGASR